MNDSTQSNKDKLAAYRRMIDQFDKQLVELINERARVVVEVGHLKRSGATQTPIYASDREKRVLQNIRSYNTGPLPDRCLDAIWKELMSASFHLERPLRIGCLGPEGSFSHLAAKLQFGSSVEYATVDEIPAVFHAVEREQADFGLVPIENSTGGGITDTLDTFLQTSARICAEVLVNIHHNVMSLCPAEQIQTIYSRPEIFGQCRRWLGVHCRQAQHVATTSSAKAAELATTEQGAAAIGSSLAAELYNLPIRFANIEDRANNVTRFFVIGQTPPAPTGHDKTAFMFTTAHRAGALVDVLDVFRRHQINLTHIDKRPSQRVNWEYIFFVDCQGHIDDPNMQAAIEEARPLCLYLTHLGSFPAAHDVLG